MIRKLSVLFVLVLLATSCAADSPVVVDANSDGTDQAALSDSSPTEDDAAAASGDEASHDDNMTSDDNNMTSDDDAMASGDDDMGSHDDDAMASGDDDMGSHDDAAGDAHDDDDTASHDDDVAADRTVEIIMTDLAFEPTSLEVTAGETIRFLIRNDGVLEHEFRLSNAHRIEEHLASGHDDHHDDGDGGHHAEDGDVYLVLLGGEAGELVVTFPEDQSIFTEIACLIPGHYEVGMKGELSYAS